MFKKSVLLSFFVAALLVVYQECNSDARPLSGNDFVRTRGTRFMLHGKPLFFNGFNAYWLMYQGADSSTRNMIPTTFEQASKYGMNVARTWAFSDGGYRPLQVSPGVYNEEMFKALDFVLSEAKKHGVYLILTFANNWDGFGGKKQYVQWARDQGQYVNNEDDFFSNPVIKGYYKNHVKAVVTRVNSLTGVAYKDDPTIFAWELMNEPRCQSDISGKPLQDWIEEMSAYVKSLDTNHLLEVGLEGFYGDDRKQYNPGYQVGTDFIANNQIANIDFTTIHLYPDQWVSGSNEEAQAEFVEKWVQSHIQDSNEVLKKPIILAEFGKSSNSGGYTVAARDLYFGNLFSKIYSCARSGGPCGGALFWQVMAQGMGSWSDGYDVVLEQSPSTVQVINQQSQRISSLNN